MPTLYPIALVTVFSMALSGCPCSPDQQGANARAPFVASYEARCSWYLDADVLNAVGDHHSPTAGGTPDIYDLDHADLTADEVFRTEFDESATGGNEAAWSSCHKGWDQFKAGRAGERDPVDLAALLDEEETSTTTTTGPDLDDVVEITTTTTTTAPAPTSPPATGAASPTTAAPPPTTTAPTTTVRPTTTTEPECEPPATSTPGVVINWSHCEPFTIAGTCTDHDGAPVQRIWGTVDPAFSGRLIRAQYHEFNTTDYEQTTIATVTGDGAYTIEFPGSGTLGPVPTEYVLDGLDVELSSGGIARISPPGQGGGHEEVAGPDAGRFFVDGPSEACP